MSQNAHCDAHDMSGQVALSGTLTPQKINAVQARAQTWLLDEMITGILRQSG